ncbi:hypothetical protein E6A51_12365, partial [Brachyspira hampsonii]|nr:hypothetical protein [Brachyspira hampsonii]MBW5395996.1 hypothetical protein [Brachyspira hampsonii]
SKSGHDKINVMLKNAEDELDILLVHSGVPAVEIAINDYLEKYIMVDKIRKGVNTLIGYIKERNIENNIAASLLENEIKLKEFNRRISDEVKLVDKYDDIYEKLNVLRGIIRNAESIENRIKEIKINKIWLDDFINKVIHIIEL